MDHSLPGSSLPGILQARVLEWDAISLSIITLEWSLTVQMNHRSFPSNQKIEIIKHSKEDMSKAETSQKLDLLCQLAKL